MNYKTLIYIILLLLSKSLSAQNNFEVAYTITELKLHGSIENLNEEGKAFTQKVIDKSKKTEYKLIVNNFESSFNLKKILGIGEESEMDKILSKMGRLFTSFNEKVYVDHQNKIMVFVVNLAGKDFTVKKKLYDFKWDIKKEAKTILGYKVNRAVCNHYYPITNEKFEIEAWFAPSTPIQAGH